MPAPVYTSRAFLTQAGVDTSDLSASQLNYMLRGVSSFIDGVTGQRFNPFEETVLLSGDDNTIIYRSDFLPILSVSDITIYSDRTNRRGMVFSGGLRDIVIPDPQYVPDELVLSGVVWDFPAGSYQLRPHSLPRFIEAIDRVFPGGVANIGVTGVFGWPERDSVKSFSTTTTAKLTRTSTTLTLTTVDGLEIRDVLQLGNVALIANDIDVTNKKVYIDAPDTRLTAELAIGTTVKSFGATPFDIEKVANYLFRREYARRRLSEDGDWLDPIQIKREKTVDYEYEVLPPTQVTGSLQASGLIGIPEYDAILLNHIPDPLVIFA